MPRGNRSQQLFDAAKKVLPGGVDSPVRAFNAVGGEPLFIERGEGAFITDVDGNRYIDYVMSWGPLILGHAHPRVLSALAETAALGTSFGAPSELEVELATRVRALMPAIDMIRFVNSGTEATMSALRLARAFTGRHKIIKFEGNYHGHADALLAKAGSGVATLGLPDSPGVTPGAAQDTLLARYNDGDSVAALFEQHPQEIAAVIVEPVAGNMGLIAPHDGFLAALRELTKQYGALLIFDEVMTGFRVHPGGAQALYGITPDLTTLGKVIGGGLPVGAYGGRRDIMEMVAPQGPMYQAGTLSGNPLAMRAGIETLDAIKDDGVWQDFERRGDALVIGLRAEAADARVSVVCERIGTMFGLFFSNRPVHNWDDAATCDTDRFGCYFRALLANGVYVAPSQFEVGFLSTAHDDDVIEQTVSAARQAFAAL